MMTRFFSARTPAGPGIAGLALCALLLSACGDEPQDATASQPTPPAASEEAGAEQTALDVGLAALSAGSALDRIATLASDAFGGRQPGTQGE